MPPTKRAAHTSILRLDMGMFGLDDEPRCCWAESELLSRAINALPNLAHLYLDADPCDDSTLALLFASLIPRTGALPPAHPQASEAASFATRLRSLAWRQRDLVSPMASGWNGMTIFVSTHHVLAHTPNLGFLLLDADNSGRDGMHAEDVTEALRHLQHPVSLLLNGNITAWAEVCAPLARVGVKELFMDMPNHPREDGDEQVWCNFLEPLADCGATLLQAGFTGFPDQEREDVATWLAEFIPTLRVVGLGEVWWAIQRMRGVEGDNGRVALRPLSDGDIYALVDWERRAGAAHSSPSSSPSSEGW